jgi:hypothetical protein
MADQVRMWKTIPHILEYTGGIRLKGKPLGIGLPQRPQNQTRYGSLDNHV